MATNLRSDDTIYVPVSKLKAEIQSPSSLVERNVLEVVGRKVRVDVGNGETELIASSKCHRNIGIMILAIGDLETESTLLDPLAKTVLQFCRLLVPDDFIKFYKVRSLPEVSNIWQREHGAVSHVIIISHGDRSSLKFANGGLVNIRDFSEQLNIEGVTSKAIISLACRTGHKSFGGLISAYDFCEMFIGPFHSVHGAIASQFVQTFLTLHLLEGETFHVAFKHARNCVAGGTSFRLWKKKCLITGPK